MAVANDYINAVIRREGHPGPYVRPRRPESAESVNTFRARVRSGLIELLDMAAGESCHDVPMAGQGGNNGPSADVVMVGFDLVHLGEPEQVASDLLEACRPGGRIAIACPAPGSFFAEIHACIEAYTVHDAVEQKRGFSGTRQALDALFGPSAIALGARDRSITLSFSSAEQWLAEWRTFYAPLKHAYTQIDPAWRAQFTNELLKIAESQSIAHDGKLSITCNYLEFVVHTGKPQ